MDMGGSTHGLFFSCFPGQDSTKVALECKPSAVLLSQMHLVNYESVSNTHLHALHFKNAKIWWVTPQLNIVLSGFLFHGLAVYIMQNDSITVAFLLLQIKEMR